MPVETFGYLDSLNATFPPISDGLVGGDDHIRGTKLALLNTFPAVNAAVTRTVTGGFGFLADAGAAAAPAFAFRAEPTLGFYRSAAGVITVAGGRLAPTGVLPTGALHQFLVAPAGLGAGAVGVGHVYLELDGSTWPNASFPDLATHLAQGGTTFVLPDMKTLGRFPRSRTATVAAGTAQANQNAAHTHTGSGTTGTESATHAHTFSGTTGSMNRSNPHSHGVSGGVYGGTSTYGNFGNFDGLVAPYGAGAIGINATDINHEHAYSGTTAAENANHNHAYSFTTSSDGGTEARPEALSVIFCIKT